MKMILPILCRSCTSPSRCV